MVSTDGCAMIRDEYPNWWNTRRVKMLNNWGSDYSFTYTWSNSCTGNSGSGTLDNNWDTQIFGPVSEDCATLIDLQGAGSGTIWLWYDKE
jgi:hypothetical protein